jgi:lipoyl-dependent peroxiredoxin subunit D
MSLQPILDKLPDYARDLKVNLQNVLQQQELTPQQTWMSAVACAIASRNKELTDAIVAAAAGQVSPEALNAGRVAGAIMGMNNVFYRFRHFIQAKPEYALVPARLRMQTIRSHGGDPVDFELACLAASTIKGCEACVNSHEQVVRDKGLNENHVTAAVRIAATIHAVATVLDAI